MPSSEYREALVLVPPFFGLIVAPPSGRPSEPYTVPTMRCIGLRRRVHRFSPHREISKRGSGEQLARKLARLIDVGKNAQGSQDLRLCPILRILRSDFQEIHLYVRDIGMSSKLFKSSDI